MQKYFFYTAVIISLFASCKGKESKQDKKETVAPLVTEQGSKITLPDTASAAFFETELIDSSALKAEITAPAKVAATVVKSQEGAAQNIVLFDNPDLASSYTSLLQNLVNIRQKTSVLAQKKNIIAKKNIEVARFKDLQTHGVGTGKDVADAQVDLLGAETDVSVTQNEIINEQTAITEHESKLKTGGFEPAVLRRAAAGVAFIICDIPESQISKIKEGQSCTIQFTAYPQEKFNGKIDDIADMIDAATRMVKLRISLNNTGNKLKAGMYATVSFGVSEGNLINVNKDALITVQAKNYVFVKQSPTVFERRELSTGTQSGNRIIVYDGLKNGEAVVIKGVMQLKGLSFGY